MERQVVAQYPDFAVVRVTVEGATQEIVSHPGSVAVVAVDDQQRVALVRQVRVAAGGSLLELPAGSLRPEETPEQAAARELREETGFTAGSWRRLAQFYLVPGYGSECMTLFLATGLAGGPQSLEPDEAIEVVLIPLADLAAQARAGGLHDAKTIAGVLLAGAL